MFILGGSSCIVKKKTFLHNSVNSYFYSDKRAKIKYRCKLLVRLLSLLKGWSVINFLHMSLLNLEMQWVARLVMPSHLCTTNKKPNEHKKTFLLISNIYYPILTIPKKLFKMQHCIFYAFISRHCATA